EVLPGLLDVGHIFSRPAGPARCSEALPAPHLVCDARAQPVSAAKADEVREDLRRYVGQLPSSWRSSNLSDACPHGAALGDAREAGGSPGKLWVGGGGSARRDALHRGAVHAAWRNSS